MENKLKQITPDKVVKITQNQVEKLTRKETIKYIISCLLFGSMSLITKGNTLGPLQFTFLRVMTGTFFLMTIFCCSTFRATLWDYTKSQLIFLIISGACIGFSWLIMADSTKKLGFITATLTYSLGPALLLVVSPILFKEVHLSASRIFGFIVCTIGIFLMDFHLILDNHSVNVIINVILAACFTVVIVFCNRKLENISGLENAMFQMIVAFLLISIVYITRHGFYFEVPTQDAWRVVLSGIINTGLPVWLYLSSIDDLRPDIIAFVGYLRPITTISIAIIFFGEPMNLETGLGAVFILGGVAIVNFFRRKQLGKTRTF